MLQPGHSGPARLTVLQCSAFHSAWLQYCPLLSPQVLNIPYLNCGPDGGSSTCTYSLKLGDTFWSVSQALNPKTDVATMLRLNPGINPNSLWVGQVCHSVICLAFEPGIVNAICANKSDRSGPWITLTRLSCFS